MEYIMLPAGGSCLLGSINLSEFVTDNKTFDFRMFVNSEQISGLTYYNKTKNEYFEFKYNENYFSKDSEFVISYSNVLNDIKIQINEENYSLYVFDTEWFPKPITL